MGVYETGTNYNLIIDGHGTGLAPPTEEQWQAMIGTMNIIDEISLQTGGPLPAMADNSSSQYFPPIGNQDGEGSCVTWAVGYYTKTYQEAREHGWNLSGASWEGGYYGHPTPSYQDKIFSPDFLYHQVNNGVDHGSAYVDVMNLVTNIGAASWSNMPYDPNDSVSWPSEEAWREAPLYRGQTGFNTFYFGSDVEDLKNLLASGNLGVISINGNLYGQLTSQDVWTTDNYNPTSTNHANTIVGFDDNFSYVEGGITKYGAFKIANSWGTGFSGDHNNDGYYWISYEAMRTRVQYFMFTEDVQNYNPQTVAVFQIEHQNRNDCNIYVGTGDPTYASSKKCFSSYFLDGGYHPFPDNKIVLDITELDPSETDLFLEVYDIGESGTPYTGTVTYFSVEEYADYNIYGNANKVLTASDTPINTINDERVRSYITYSKLITPPLLSYPSQTINFGSLAPIFTWEEVSNANSYNIEISTGNAVDEYGSFLDTVFSWKTEVQCTFISPGQIFEEGTYYWHVQAVSDLGEAGPWSEIWSTDIIPGITYLFSNGWSLISFPYLFDSELDTLLSELEGKVDFIYRWNASEGKYEYAQYISDKWKGDFSSLDNINGYWFHSNDTGLCDLFVGDGTTEVTQMDLYTNWNLVSWPRKNSVPIAEALSDINEHVDFIYRWNSFSNEYEYAQYISDKWKGDFQDFEPGYGYWIHSNETVVWTIP